MKIKIFYQIWIKNVTLDKLLGLCPVLAVTTSASNALGLGFSTIIVLVLTNGIISIIKNWIPNDLRIPIYMIVISSVVTCIDLLLCSYAFNLHESLGIFISLIITNCVILNSAEEIKKKEKTSVSLINGFLIGIGATFSMLILGIFREILGKGTVFVDIDNLLGSNFNFLYYKFIDSSSFFRLASLPPGALFILSLLLVIKRLIKNKSVKKIDCIINYK
ncbi:electron transport complex subunit RsxE [Buchnera aphidicola (Mindarus keteleerifoliae)]|uniref:electron transport complex subunit RsxE n=1 Tax=Buchnera aphidicola TaxID=9 RepID=UPI0031B6BC1E